MRLISPSTVEIVVHTSSRPLCASVSLRGSAFGNGDRSSKVSFKNDVEENSEVRVMDESDEVLELSWSAVKITSFFMALTLAFAYACKAGKPKIRKENYKTNEGKQ
ncbi:hypothetical protein QE152_g23379 [Popillia japonica]|uniref:Uncharacterized protein n=1 Tax=Popillia japonica TaxID=7064 RepID=A0AAW1KF81_POPJA